MTSENEALVVIEEGTDVNIEAFGCCWSVFMWTGSW